MIVIFLLAFEFKFFLSKRKIFFEVFPGGSSEHQPSYYTNCSMLKLISFLCVLDLLRLFDPLTMLESETPEPCLDKGGQDQEIEKLHSVLDANYAAAEKIMSLRNPNFK